MMPPVPGLLDFKLQLAPINRISPSRYEALKNCPLREVWSVGRQPQLLPASPITRLGTVIHSLFEEAGAGKFSSGGHVSIEQRWNELMAETEQAMRNSWLEQHLTPLKSTVRDFEVRRLRALQRAIEISQSPLPSVRDSGAVSPEEGLELWVESRDGLVGGYIDYVAKSPNGAVIRDYKSGDILEENSGALKSSYEIQLKLYAALYHATTGKWSVKLELIPLQGSPAPVAFDPASCSRLLDDATATLQHVNDIIASFMVTPHEAERRLANPSLSNCRHCPFRPGCAANQEFRKTNKNISAQPCDIIGTLEEIRKLGNTKLMIAVKPDEADGLPVYVRGITPGPGRYPALQHLKDRDRIGLFNLIPGSSDNGFTESQMTVIYKMI